MGCFCVGFWGIMLAGILMFNFLVGVFLFLMEVETEKIMFKQNVQGNEEACPVYLNRKGAVH